MRQADPLRRLVHVGAQLLGCRTLSHRCPSRPARYARQPPYREMSSAPVTACASQRNPFTAVAVLQQQRADGERRRHRGHEAPERGLPQLPHLDLDGRPGPAIHPHQPGLARPRRRPARRDDTPARCGRRARVARPDPVSSRLSGWPVRCAPITASETRRSPAARGGAAGPRACASCSCCHMVPSAIKRSSWNAGAISEIPNGSPLGRVPAGTASAQQSSRFTKFV